MTLAIAKQKGREVAIEGKQKYWTDQGCVLLGSHGPCTVCGRQTRWRYKLLQFYIPCCSRACRRTRFDS